VSRSPQKLVAIQHACTRFEACRDLLIAAIDRHDSRSCLDAFVELCTLHLEQTGGTLVTATYRAQLATLRAVVETRSHLALVAKKDPIMFEIESAVCCPLCGAPGLVTLSGGGGFECHCSGCYDGTEDSGPACQVIGSGATAREAVGDWCTAMEGHLPEHVGWWPTNVAAHARAEFQRQAGWVETATNCGVWCAPEILDGAKYRDLNHGTK